MFWNVYTDGSFGDDGATHGSVVFASPEGNECIHVWTENPTLVASRNIGGECIAAWSALYAIVTKIKEMNEKGIEQHTARFTYDYQGVGAWVTREWKNATKPTAVWYRQAMDKLLAEVPNLTVEWNWVKGHTGKCPGNTLADKVSAYNMSYCKFNHIPIVKMVDSVLGGGI